MINRKKYSLILSLLTFSFVFSQVDSLRLKKLEMKVNLIEEYKSNIEQYSRIQLEKDKDELKKETKNVSIILTIFLIIGAPSTIYTIYMMFWGVNKRIKKAIDDKITNIVEEKREDIIKLIKNQAFDRILKETKKILIISKTEDSQKNIKKVVSGMGFNNLIFRQLNTMKNIPENDLLVFNNIDGSFSQNEIDKIVKSDEREDSCFVAYTLKQLDRNPRMNFANSKFTLYNAILTTLTFMNTIENK